MSVWPAKPFTKSVFIFGASLAFAFCSPAARAADAEAVTVDTTFTVRTPPVRLDRPARSARASVVLMTGGDGLLSLDVTGTIIDSTGNFLIRSADLFLRYGLNVMMADAAPAHPGGLSAGTRLGATHAAELQGFINAALNRWGKPVWVVSTSNGSISTVTAAGFQPALAGAQGCGHHVAGDESFVGQSADFQPLCIAHHSSGPRRVAPGRPLLAQPAGRLGDAVRAHPVTRQSEPRVRAWSFGGH